MSAKKKKKGGLSQLFYKNIMPKIYGIGASVVIIGALFKILHIPGADEMLMLGLSTEAFIFFLSAFEPAHPEVDWGRVYPELSEDYETPMGDTRSSRISNRGGANDSPLLKVDEMLRTAKVDQNLLDNLGKGLNNLAASASRMNTLSDAAVATNEYAKNVQVASTALTEMNKSYGVAMKAASAMSDASKDTGEYHAQVQRVTKNLSALSAVYETELKDADSHVKNMSKFYETLTGAMHGLAKVGGKTNALTDEIGKMSDSIAELNKVYGNILTAMRSPGR